MKRKTKTSLIVAILTIFISNTPPVNYFLQESYSYQNKDGSFTYTEEPGKGLDFEVGQIRWSRFKKQNPNNPNKTLLRTFDFKPWRFWEWLTMLKDWERYSLEIAQ